MATEWKSQQGDGKYALQFETDDREKYMLVENAAHMAVLAVNKYTIHGRWIYERTYREADECHCSLCGQLMTTQKGKRMNYCPNCGAKMDAEL